MQNWADFFREDGTVKISMRPLIERLRMVPADGWTVFFNSAEVDNLLKKIDAGLCKVFTESPNIFPFPQQVFRAFELTKFENIRAVILGQDPYFGKVDKSGKIDRTTNIWQPQATGLSFSVNDGCTIPSSLNNIFKNMYKFHNFTKLPPSGNLTKWATQGCLMLNCSLTVPLNDANAHAHIWTELTDSIIKFVSDNCENVVFMLWGKFAINKSSLIDTNKHKIIKSSHPSGNSYYKTVGTTASFSSVDHFTQCNDFLKSVGKPEIDWQL